MAEERRQAGYGHNHKHRLAQKQLPLSFESFNGSLRWFLASMDQEREEGRMRIAGTLSIGADATMGSPRCSSLRQEDQGKQTFRR